MSHLGTTFRVAAPPEIVFEQREVRGVLRGIEGLLGASPGVLADARVEVDDGFVGDGYGIPTPNAS